MKNSEFSEKFFEILVNHFIMELGYNIYVPSQNKESKTSYDALIHNFGATKRSIKAFAMQFKIVDKYDRLPSNGDIFRFNLYHITIILSIINYLT